jgi:hypothetical protein
MRREYFKTKTEWFIETGSLAGDGIDLALRSGFYKVFSIELADHYYQYCVDRFKNDERVEIIHGDSLHKLKELLDSKPNTSFTYWLDGHYSGGDTGFGVKESPLMEELEYILSRKVESELIYVDDMRIYRNFNEELNTENILKLVEKYKPHAKIWYESSDFDPNDILVIEY